MAFEFDFDNAEIVKDEAPKEENKGFEFDIANADIVNDTPLAVPLAEPEEASVLDRVADTGIDLTKGAVGLGESIVGLGDMATGGYLGKGMKALGYDPEKSGEFLTSLYSDERKIEEGEYNKAEGFADSGMSLLKNPSLIAGKVVETAPMMLGIMGTAKYVAAKAAKKAHALAIEAGATTAEATEMAAMAAAKAGTTAASIAEGAMQAGSSFEELERKGVDLGTNYAASIASGVLTGTISKLGGELGKKIGLGDIEAGVAAKKSGGDSWVAKLSDSLAGRVVKSGLQEGMLEEMPQSAQETAWSNWAQDKDIYEGMGKAMATGAVVGFAAGGGMSAVSGGGKSEEQITTEQVDKIISAGSVEEAIEAANEAVVATVQTEEERVANEDLLAQIEEIAQPEATDGTTNGVGQAGVVPEGVQGTSDNAQGTNANGILRSDTGTPMELEQPQPFGATEELVGTYGQGEFLPSGSNEQTSVTPEQGKKALAELAPEESPKLDAMTEQLDKAEAEAKLAVKDQGEKKEVVDFKDSEKGDTITVYKGDGSTIDVEVKDKGSVAESIIADVNGEDVVLGFEYGLHDPKSPSYKMESIEGSPSVASLDDAVLKQQQVRAKEKLEAHKGQHTEAEMSRNVIAIDSEIARRAGTDKATPIVESDPKRAGKPTKIQMPDNTELNAQWEVVDADEITATLSEGKNQPRDRNRQASKMQVKNIADNVNYGLLNDSPIMDTGAPTITKDGAIVAGNGRFEGVSQAYDQGSATDYLERMQADLEARGIKPSSLEGMNKPILVRRLTDDVDERKVAIASNSGSSLQYSAMERAKLDGEVMQGLDKIEVLDNGDISNNLSNVENIRTAFKGLNESELGSLTDKDGGLSQEGARRIKNALIFKAYGDSPTLARMIESNDSEMKNITGALMRAAGTVSKVRAGMETGKIDKDMDIATDLTDAVEILSRIKQNGSSVTQYLGQTDMFGDEVSGEVATILQSLADNARSQNKVYKTINNYYEGLLGTDNATGDLFGEDNKQTKQERLDYGFQEAGKSEREEKTQDLFTKPNEERQEAESIAESDQGKLTPEEQRDWWKSLDRQERTSLVERAGAESKKGGLIKPPASWNFISIANREKILAVKDAAPVEKDNADVIAKLDAQLTGEGIDVAPKVETVKEDKLLGKNKNGFEIYEDDKGVRYYVESGIKISQSVMLNGQGQPESTTLTDDYIPVKQEREYQPSHYTDYDQSFMEGNFEIPNAEGIVSDEAIKAASDFVSKHGKPKSPEITSAEKAKAKELLEPRIISAKTSMPLFSEKVMRIARLTGNERMIAPIKSVKRAVTKLVIENGMNINRMRDLVRATIVVKNKEEFDKVIAKIKQEFEVTSHKDRYAEPLVTGYRDHLLNVKLKDGSEGEIQINTPEMIAAKEGVGHAVYEIERALDLGSKEMQEAQEIQREVYATAYEKNLSRSVSDVNGLPLSGSTTDSETTNQEPSTNAKQSPDGDSNQRVDLGKSEAELNVIDDTIAENAEEVYTDIEEEAVTDELQTNDNRSNEEQSAQTAPPVEGEQQAGGVRRELVGADEIRNKLPNVPDRGTERIENGEVVAETDSDTQRSSRTSEGESDSGIVAVPAGRNIAPKTGLNYHFTEADLTYAGSWLQKATKNVEAVELIAKLRTEERLATKAEQKVLAQFIGWGAGDIRNNIFDDQLDTRARSVTAINDVLDSLNRNNKKEMSRFDYNYYQMFMLVNKDGKLNYNDPLPLEAIKKAKPSATIAKWIKLRDRLKVVMTTEEWKEAARSTQYAHYTDKAVIDAMWKAMDGFGFKGGSILEPGAGNGLFPGLAPRSISSNSSYTGIEFDSFTGEILKNLQQDERILVESFFDTSVPDNFYDIAIGNPPFADTKVLSDPRYKKKAFSLHNFFFAKSIDRVKQGGVLAFVTSRYTMDSKDTKARDYLADRADLLGAIRLPSGAFGKNAGTQVVTDIIFLRKKVDGQKFEGNAWKESADSGLGAKNTINEYFVAHPEMVLGEAKLGRGMYSNNEYKVVPHADKDINELLEASIAKLPREIFTPENGTDAKAAQVQELDWNPKAQKEGNYYINDAGAVMQVENKIGVPVKAGKDTAIIKSFVKLRDAVNSAQYDQLNDGKWKDSLAVLQKEYKAFVKAHGNVLQNRATEREVEETNMDTGEVTTHTVTSRTFTMIHKIDDDPEYTKVMALESIDSDTGIISTTPFLDQRVLEKPKTPKIETPHDSLLTVLDEYGRVDIPEIAKRIDMDEKTVIEALGSSIYKAPSGGWQMVDEYLSGDVKTKLSDAREAAQTDKSYERNVKALEDVQPNDLAKDDVVVAIGANWFDPQLYAKFLYEKSGVRMDISFNEVTNKFNVGSFSGYQGNVEATVTWGTDRRHSGQVFELALTGRPIHIKSKDRDNKEYVDPVATAAVTQKVFELREEFKTWIWEDEAREKSLLKTYNERLNRNVSRTFNGEHLTLPGTTTLIDVFNHVKRGAWRVIQTGNTYLAHAVGSGKTWEMVISAMEQKRLGMINKPMMVVPNHMLQQFSNEWMQLYPAARLMVADERQFTKAKRQRFVARAAMSDLDGVIITHSAFKLLDVDHEFKAKMIQEEIDYMEASRDSIMEEEGETDIKKTRNRKVREIQNRIEKQEEVLKGLMSGEGKDQGVMFSDMGVDMLYVDEAHEFRKLAFSTARQVKGIDSSGSQQAFDLFIKSRWIESKNPGRSLVLASGTPITNTLGELYTVQRFMQPEVLEERGLQEFDAWASAFGEESTTIEADAGGRYAPVTRFSKFINVPELTQMFRNFADVLTSDNLAEMLGDKRPKVKGGSRSVVITPELPEYLEYKADLATRLEESRAWRPSKEEPNNPDPIIKIIGDGRLAAIDMRFIDPSLPSNPDSKLNTMIDEVIKTYKETSDNAYYDRDNNLEELKGAAQMVFAAVGFGAGVAKNRGFDARKWLEQRMAKAGIPANEVAFMSDYKKSTLKQKLFNDVNTGKVRILIGSDANMGTGVNAQQRLIALHHLDAHWFPAAIEQREGRIIRQGNKNPEVTVNAFSTGGSYDSNMWQMLASKQRFIDQALSGDSSVRQMDDISEASQYEMAMAMTAGDPRVIELAGIKSDVEKYRRLLSSHQSNVSRMRRSIESAEESTSYAKGALPAAKKVAAKVADLSGDKFVAKFKDTEITKRKDWGIALLKALKAKSDKMIEGSEKIGELSGFDVLVSGHTTKNGSGKVTGYTGRVLLRIGDKDLYPLAMDVNEDAVGLVARAVNTLVELKRKPASMEATIKDNDAKLDSLKSKVDAPFQFKAELEAKLDAAEQIEKELLEDDIDLTADESVLVAKAFATRHHEAIDQKRKYTNEPYIVHPAGVVDILKDVPHTKAMLSAAWAHDTVEDTNATLEDVRLELGDEVAELVEELTDPSYEGTREEKFQQKMARSKTLSPSAQTIKLADILSNLSDIEKADNDFAAIYFDEKKRQIEALTDADSTLLAKARELTANGIKYSVGGEVSGMTSAQAKKSLVSLFGSAVNRAIKKGTIQIVDAVADIPNVAKHIIDQGKIRGAFDETKGVTYIVAANNDAETLGGVFLHEATHAFFNGEKGQAVMAEANRQIAAQAKLAKNGKGAIAEWITEARAIIPASTNLDERKEELLAYAVQQHEDGLKQPSAIKRIAGNLIAEFKAFIIRHTRIKLGLLKIDNKTLAALARQSIGIETGTGKTTVTNKTSRQGSTFYSQMRLVLDNKLPGKGTAKSFKQMIEAFARKGEFKAEELEWSGVSEWLDSLVGKKMTKQDVLDYMDANQINVEEVLMGTDLGKDIEDVIEERQKFMEKYIDKAEAEGYDYTETYDAMSALQENSFDSDAWEVINKHEFNSAEEYDPNQMHDFSDQLDEARALSNSKTKYQEYTLSGGENYREFLMTLPLGNEQAVRDSFVARMKDKYDGFFTSKFNDAETKENKETLSAAENPSSFTSPHYEAKNILATARMKDRVTTDGDKTLFLEEIQSDWHQDGRKKGYTKVKTRKTDAIESDMRNRAEELGIEMNEVYTSKDPTLIKLFAELDNPARGAAEVMGSVPDAPFKTTWPMLAFKRMIREAAAKGYDSITWTTGEQQAERYDLSKQVDGVQWSLYADDVVDIHMLPSEMGAEYEKAGRYKLSELEGVIGKELAAKVIDQHKSGDVNGEFTGIDLKVGGEGMASFYDKMLPSAVNKYVKKWGGKVGVASIPLNTHEYKYDGDMASGFVVLDSDGYVVEKGFTTRIKAKERAMELNNSTTAQVHSLKITDAMREAAMQGQPMFSRMIDGSRPAPIKIGSKPQREDARSEARKVVDEIYEESGDNPFDPRQGVRDGVVFEINASYDGNLHLSDLRALEQGKGAGSRFMEYITAKADKAGVTVELFAEPYGAQGMLKDDAATKRLEAFYAQYGFVEEDGMMIREPSNMKFSQPYQPELLVEDNFLPEETKGQKTARIVQDKMNRFKSLRDWMAKAGQKLSEAADVWMIEGNMHGKIAARLEDFREETVKPLIKRTQESQFDMTDIAEYLEMKHVPEANARMRKIHHNDEATANGITDEQAQAILAKHESHDDFAELEALANEWRAISNHTLDMLVASGLKSQEEADAYKETYEFYVPLKGTDAATQGTGKKGLSVNAKSKRRMGHGDREEAVIENMLRDHERAIMLIETNTVAVAIAQMAVEANNPDMITVNRPAKRQVFKNKPVHAVMYEGTTLMAFNTEQEASNFIKDDANNAKRNILLYDTVKSYDPMVQFMASPMLADNEITAYINGKSVRMQLNDPLLARAATNMGVEHLGVILAGARTFNAWLSKAYTGYNPEFAGVNMIRDLFAGTINLTGDYGVGMMAKVYANYPMAFKELIKSFADPKASKLITEYRRDGGNTGAAYIPDIERVGDDVMDSYNEYAGAIDTYNRVYNESIAAGKSKGAAHLKASAKSAIAKFKDIPIVGHFLTMMMHINAVTENALRVATYHTLKENGYSNAKAAQAAKMSTVNFNRKGEIGAQAGALYLFFNPAIQGTERIISVLGSSEHKAQSRAMVGAMTLGAFAMAEAMRAGDDDEWDVIPDFVKDRNIIIMVGDMRFMIPVPYGYSIFHTLGNVMSDVVHGMDPWEAGVRLTDAIFDNFSPVGSPLPDGNLRPLQLLPTAVKMVISPEANENNFGRPIQPIKYSEDKPDSQNMYRNTHGSLYDAVAKGMNEITGGNAYTKGVVDVSPETIKFWVTSLTGGAGKFIADTISLGNVTARQADPELSEIPIIRKFAREKGIAESRGAFWEATREIKDAVTEFNAATKAGDKDVRKRLLTETSDLRSLAKYMRLQQKLVKAKREEITAIKESGKYTLAEQRLKIKQLEKEETKIYESFIKTFKRKTKG